jgi:hypothetical protein
MDVNAQSEVKMMVVACSTLTSSKLNQVGHSNIILRLQGGQFCSPIGQPVVLFPSALVCEYKRTIARALEAVVE